MESASGIDELILDGTQVQCVYIYSLSLPPLFCINLVDWLQQLHISGSLQSHRWPPYGLSVNPDESGYHINAPLEGFYKIL